MKLWIGAEAEAAIADVWRGVRKDVESAINAKIETITYPIEIDGWKCIAIIRNDVAFAEITKFSKARRSMDFRLAIDFRRFADADDLQKRRLLFGLLIRSLELLIEKGANQAGVRMLLADTMTVGAERAWI